MITHGEDRASPGFAQAPTLERMEPPAPVSLEHQATKTSSRLRPVRVKGFSADSWLPRTAGQKGGLAEVHPPHQYAQGRQLLLLAVNMPEIQLSRPRDTRGRPFRMRSSSGFVSRRVGHSAWGPGKRSSTPKSLSGGSARVVLDPLAAAAVAARRQYVGRVVEAHRPTAAIRAAIASDARFLTYIVHEHSPRLPTQVQANVNSLSDPGRVGVAIRGGSRRPEITPAGTPAGVLLCADPRAGSVTLVDR